MKVIYSEKQVSDPGEQKIYSPSARKPKEVAEALKDVEFVSPEPLTILDFKRVHDSNYVDNIMNLKEKNGFGTISQSVVDSLPYTNGAQYTAAKLAKINEPTAALVSGFHHAGYDNWKNFGWFCTFNGLVIAAAKLLKEDNYSRVCIIDCDMHWGNGTDNILEKVNLNITHVSFGKYFLNKTYAKKYLEWLEPEGRIHNILLKDKPNVIIYQSGADVHVDDPFGGVLNTEEMYERDLKMFKIAKELRIPITWNLAGGYQVDKNGSINKVIELHLNTFKACKEVYDN